MALLDDWLNADLFSQLRDKVNAIVTAVNFFGGGTANQLLFKTNSNDFEVEWRNRVTTEALSGYNTGWSASGTNNVSISAIGDVHLDFNLGISTGGTTSVLTLATTYRPVTAKRFVIADYNGTDSASALMVINIATSGDITIFKQADGTKPINRTTLTFSINYNALV